jgi:hypothetical protein
MDPTELGLCGLYCGLCASRRRIPEQASQLRRTLMAEGYDEGYFDIPGLHERFAAFWEGLNLLAATACAGCRAGGGNPDCAIRHCALERQLLACPDCADFPCDKLGVLGRYPLYLADAARLKAIGFEAWADEQEGRARCGFSYADVRHPG